MERLKDLGVDRVRLTANWSVLTRDTEAEQAPAFDAADPAAYEQARWRGLDRAVIAADEAGLDVLMDIGFWAPHWATDDPPGPRARTTRRSHRLRRLRAGRAAALRRALRPCSGDRARAEALAGRDAARAHLRAQRRRSRGRRAGRRVAACVGQFALSNEPNHPSLLLPQWRGRGATARPASPALYRRMLAAAVPAAREVRPDADLLIGNTSSAAGRPGSGAVPPLRFVRELACVDRALRPLHTRGCAHFKPMAGDGWAHHPYTRNRRPDEPAGADRPDDVASPISGSSPRSSTRWPTGAASVPACAAST